jgi:hypothetical protein
MRSTESAPNSAECNDQSYGNLAGKVCSLAPLIMVCDKHESQILLDNVCAYDVILSRRMNNGDKTSGISNSFWDLDVAVHLFSYHFREAIAL